MANKMKKTLALVLAISMLASQLALPAIAADGQEGQISDQITVTDSSTSTTVDPATGAETEVSNVEGITPSGAQVTQQTTTTTSHQEAAHNPMDFQHQTTWTEETTVTQPNGDTTTATTNGSETIEGDVVTNPDLSQTYSQSGTGSEATLTESTETRQVSQNEEVLDAQFETGGDTGENKTDLNTPADENFNSDWNIGTPDVDENGWKQVGDVEEGAWTAPQDVPVTDPNPQVVVPDPKLNDKAEDDVSIKNLTPGGEAQETEVAVTLSDVASGRYPEIFEVKPTDKVEKTTVNGKTVYTITTVNGIETTVKELQEVDGGFQVTTTTTTDPGVVSTVDNQQYKDQPVSFSDPTYTNPNGAAGEKSSVKIDEFEQKLNQGTTSGTEADGNRTSVVTTSGTADITTPSGAANGVKTTTTTTVKDMTDTNGNKGYNETTTIKYENVVTVENNVPLADANNTVPDYADQVTVDHRYDQPQQANDVLALAVSNRDNGDGTFSTITVKEVLESNGSSSILDVTGYEVVETKTDKDGNVLSTESKTHNNVVPPMVLDRDNGDGTFTNVSLTEIIADQDTAFYKAGDIIGYTAHITLSDAEGNVLESKARDVFGTEVTLTTTVTTNAEDMTKTTTYERTDTYVTNAFASHYERTANLTATQKRTYQIDKLEEIATYLEKAENPENLTFIYQGKMLGVKLIENGGHGSSNTFDVTTVDMAKYDHDDGIQGKDYKDYRAPGKPDTQYHNYSGMYDNSNTNTADWQYNGKGLLSIFKIQAGSDASSSNMQEGKMFRVVKGGEERFVYCVEFGQNVQTGDQKYTEYVYGDVTQLGTQTFKSSVVDAYLCSTALNGFWGNETGIGSLEAVKDFLRRMGEEDAAENLTAGEAVTATQAVMWHFTADAEGGDNDFVSGKFVTFINALDGNATRSDYNEDGKKNYRTDENVAEVTNDSRVQRIYALYDALVAAAKADQADGKSGAAQAISAENITAGQIDVKQSMGNQTYNTDLHVKLDVSQSSINDDLLLTVKTENGNFKFRLSGSCAADETYVTMDNNGNVVLPDVVLKNNENVTVELTGQQTLDKGVLIYKSSSSQDFIGLSTKLHKVALQFGYWLNIIDPEIEAEKEASKQSKVNTVTYQTDASRVDTRDTKTVTHDGYTTDKNTYVSQLNGIVTKTLKIDKATLEAVRWNFYYEYVITVVDDEDGGNGDEIILDDEVPLAAAPKTGDPSLAFAAMSALSMAGSTILGRKGKKDEE